MGDLQFINKFNDIQDAIDSNPVVVVEFGAEWCQPCKKFEPHFVEAAKRTDAVCIKVDIEQDPQVMKEFNIKSVPQVYLFRDGRLEKPLKSRTAVPLLKEIDY